MCYSEKLSSEGAAYQTETGWIFVAWKAVLIRDGRLFALGNRKHEYQPLALVRDRHGFHVAATRRGAVLAASKFKEVVGHREEWDDEEMCPVSAPVYRAWERKVETLAPFLRRVHGGILRLVRCLVPSHSVGEGGHVHAMIVLPPRMRETADLIALAERENRRLHRSLSETNELRDAAMAKLRALCVRS